MGTTSRDRAARAGLTALLVTATLALAGCSGGDKADAGPQPRESESVSTSPSASASASASASTGVAPATGKPVETSWFTARVPERYEVDVMGEDFHIDATGPSGQIAFGIIPLSAGHEYTVPQLARNMRGYLPGLHDADVGSTTTIDGETAYQLTAKEQYHVSTDVGLTHDGQIIHMSVSTYGSPADNRRLLESVLATWRWK